MQKNKIVNLDVRMKEKALHQKRGVDGQYRCFMAGNRLAGSCEIIIYDVAKNTAELFHLSFSTEGVTGHQYLDKDEMMLWQYHKEDMQGITYHQALILLGDAVRQNYKYQMQVEWSKTHESLHIQRIWKKEYYDYINCSIDWLLQIQEPVQFLSIYIDAIRNKDAVLLYDMMTEEKKCHISREVYAYSWNHVLEEINISNYEILYIEQQTEEKSWDIYIAICGGYGDMATLSVDLCLKLIKRNNRLQLLQESVLDAHHVFSK